MTYPPRVQQPGADAARSLLSFILLLAAAAVTVVCVFVVGLGWMMLHGYGSCGPVTPNDCNDSVVGPLAVILAFGFVALWAPFRWAVWWRRTRMTAAAEQGPASGDAPASNAH